MAATNLRASMIDGIAFYDQDGEIVGGFAGNKITLIDGSANEAVGYIKAVGTGETYGAELLTNGNFSAWAGVAPDEIPDNWTRRDGPFDMATRLTENPADQCQILSDGTLITLRRGSILFWERLYKIFIDIKTVITGSVQISVGGKIQTYNTTGIKTIYAHANDSRHCDIARVGVTNITFDDASIKQILTPSTNGVTIVSTFGGSTENWTSVDGSFDFNDIASYILAGSLRQGLGNFGFGTQIN